VQGAKLEPICADGFLQALKKKNEITKDRSGHKKICAYEIDGKGYDLAGECEAENGK
jgi:hypothetical protein